MPKLIDNPSSSDSDHSLPQTFLRSLLSWKRRKVSFRVVREMAEPLLNEACREEGGDDIDFNRRQSRFPTQPPPVKVQFPLLQCFHPSWPYHFPQYIIHKLKIGKVMVQCWCILVHFLAYLIELFWCNKNQLVYHVWYSVWLKCLWWQFGIFAFLSILSTSTSM